jgi:hypothetical protein
MKHLDMYVITCYNKLVYWRYVMRKALSVISFLTLATLCVAPQAFAFGEEILAASGQYTFFIKPAPGSPVTYYQKMVPCVITEEMVAPRPVAPVFPVPVPVARNVPVVRTEMPVGCAVGQSPCIECRPLPSTLSATAQQIVPKMVPVRVPGVEPVPKMVKRKIMLPQWFAVSELPKPPVRKVH